MYGNGGPGTDLDRLAVQLQNEVDKVASGGATAQELMQVKKVNSSSRVEVVEGIDPQRAYDTIRSCQSATCPALMPLAHCH